MWGFHIKSQIDREGNGIYCHNILRRHKMRKELNKKHRQQYYLDPFSKPIKITDSSRDRYVPKETCTIIKNIRDIAHIEDTSTLLIDGHSGKNVDILANAFSNATETYTGVKLAMVLQPYLPKTHIKIRLLACHGGTLLARNLAIWLARFGYRNIAVGGYMTTTWSGKTHRTLIDDGIKEPWENFTNSGAVRWYNGSGNLITKPAVISNSSLYNPAFPTCYNSDEESKR